MIIQCAMIVAKIRDIDRNQTYDKNWFDVVVHTSELAIAPMEIDQEDRQKNRRNSIILKCPSQRQEIELFI